MKILLTFLFLIVALPVWADVPDLAFSQQVNIVVTAKQDPRIFDVKIKQKEEKIRLDLIVDQNVDRAQAKKMAHDMIMLAKSMSLDDPPKDKKQPGKGLYSYQVTISRPDGVVLLIAKKMNKKAAISFEDQVDLQPLTRAGAAGR